MFKGGHEALFRGAVVQVNNGISVFLLAVKSYSATAGVITSF